jgi:Raf kinase inhibitor-like YbhB/YbcL family protein
MRTVKVVTIGMLAAGAAVALTATASAAEKLKVTVGSIQSEKMIPPKHAFCAAAKENHVKTGGDVSPSVSWSKGPNGTKSYAVILYDTEAPAEQREKMNKEGMVLTSDVPRRIFYHWVLIDVPASVTSIKEGAESEGRVAKGKPATPAAAGVRGLNDFTKVMAANEAMKGQYYGYDGPCPPWNDEKVHRYHYAVYALSVPSLSLKDPDGVAVMEAIKGKVLAEGEVVGLFTTNPAKGATVE